MRDKDQLFIFNDQELSLIKNTFSENDELLYAVRKVLLQFELTPDELKLLRTINIDVYNVLKKRILPEIGDEFPLGQLSDIRTTITGDLKTKSPEEMMPLFQAKQLEISYLQQQLNVIRDIAMGVHTDRDKVIKLTELREINDSPMTFVNMTAYLFLLGYIDPMMNFIKVIAGTKKETVEEAKERMKRDSAK